MKQTDETPIFPVAPLTVGPIPRLDIIVIRPDFLTHMTQTPEEAQQGRTYALTPKQGQELIQQIQRALHVLETSGSKGSAYPKH